MSRLSWAALVVSVLAILVLADFEFNGPRWQSLTAAQKKQQLWAAITQDPSEGSFPSPVELAQLFIFSMSTSFDTVAEDMPYQGVFSLFRRQKVIHSVGAISQVKWVSTGGHPYTGLFQGSSHALLRFSLAKKPDYSTSTPFAPGLSFKLLRNGRKSANFMAMVSLSGVPTANFFQKDFSNHVPDLFKNADTALLLLKKTFAKASTWPVLLGISDVARYDENGKEYSPPQFPFRLIFHAPPNVRSIFSGVSQLDDLPRLFSSTPALQPGLKLFDIYAEPKPLAQAIKIGELYLETAPVSTKFGDQILFFQHQRKEEDFAFHPDWVAPTQQLLEQQQNTPNYYYPDLPDN